MRLFAMCLAVLLFAACSPNKAERLTVKVHGEYPHSTNAFTQGLLFDGEHLYESTGLVGQSSVRRVKLETGAIERQSSIPEPHFGEGLELVNDTLYMLTWQHGQGFTFAKDTLQRTGEFTYSGEGWGLCFDGEHLWMSNGTSTLSKRSVPDFAELGTVTVKLDGEELTMLNELECVDGAIYANIWLVDDIVRIDPASGTVTAHIDASSLRERIAAPLGPDATLNGIAYNETAGEFYLTGKLWPTLFAVTFEPKE